MTEQRLGWRRFPSVFGLLVSAFFLIAPGSARAQELVRVPLQHEAAKLAEVETATGTAYTLPGARPLRDFGMPALPVLTYEVLIPRDRQVRAVEVVGAREIVLVAPIALAVDPGIQTEDGSTHYQRLFEPSATAYPDVQARLTADQFDHGYHVVAVQVYPLRWHAERGELRFSAGGELVLQLEPRARPLNVVDRVRDLPGWRERVREGLAARVVNPSALANYDLPSPVSGPLKHAEPLGKTPSLASSPVRYLIITNSDMQPQFQRLIDHRRQQGLPGLVVTVDDILANYRQGIDLAETIRLYIADAYAKWGVDYVLLGGDSGVLTPRYVRSSYYPPSGHTDIPADLYFSCLDDNWNADGDNLFGEPFLTAQDQGDFVDFTPELALGRAPVNNLAEAQVFVDKVLEYENPTNIGYQTSALFASEVLFPQDWDGIIVPQLDGAVYSEQLKQMIDGCDTHGDWSYYCSYENYTAYLGAVQETKASVLAELNSGNHGVFNHIGHGFFFNASVGDDVIRVEDADQLNNGPNFFVMYALNCSSGAFDLNCLLERFLRNPNGGSVVSIGSSRSAFPNTANDYQQEFYQAVMCGGMPRLGDAVNQSRSVFTIDTFFNTVDRWTHFVYTLLGDPAMPMWTQQPRAVQIAAPASVNVGDNNIGVTVTEQVGGAFVAGAMVTLEKDGEVYASAATDISGQVLLAVRPETDGALDVFVRLGNAVAFTSQIPVLAGPAPDVSINDLVVSTGQLKAGESVQLTAMVHNGGAVATAGGTLTLSTADPYITIIDGDDVFPALAAGGSASVADAFTVEIDINVPDNHEAVLTVEADESGVGTWSDDQVLSLVGSELEIYTLELDDTATGNGDGIVDAGEQVDLVFTLKNFGSGAAGVATGVLSSVDVNTTVQDGAGTWGALDNVLDTADNDADRFKVVEADVSAPILYSLTVTDESGRVLSVVDFDLRRPVQVAGVAPGLSGPGATTIEWDVSADTDLRGYRVYRKSNGSAAKIPGFEIASADVIEGSSVFFDQGLPGLTAFEYYVVALDAGGLESLPSAIIEAITTPREVSCFPLPIGRETSGSLAVGHLDGDGELELIVPSEFIYVIDGKCQEKQDGDSNAQTFGPFGESSGFTKYEPAGVAMGNLDDDPWAEIVASDWDNKSLVAYDQDGSYMPGFPILLHDRTWSTPVLGDLDNDGDLEIVVIDVKGWTYAFHHDGTEVADGDNNPGTMGPIAPRRVDESFGRNSVALYDVDNNGRKEILFGTFYLTPGINDEFHALQTDGSGTNAAGWPIVLGDLSQMLASPTIADINDDGIDEIVTLTEADQLFVWRPDGSQVAPFPATYISNSPAMTPSPAVADFTGDGKLEIVLVETITALNAQVRIIDYQNNTLPGWPVSVGSLSESSPVIGDINGDGSLDVVFGVGGGTETAPDLLYAWNMDGTIIEGFPLTLEGPVRATPTLCDFNSDGSTNIVLASWDLLIHVWDMEAPYDPAKMPWPTFRGNNYRNGVYGTVVPTSTRGSTPGLTNAAHMLPNVPNPFNPTTTLRFEISGDANARTQLDIYDAAGRHVARLLDEPLSPGMHQVRWHGRDRTGRQVVSGVYYARLSVEGRAPSSRKLTLVK